MARVSICFVCLGNICRSPTAEGIFRAMAEEAGVARKMIIDSAGTYNGHEGSPPDARSTATARKYGVILEGRSRPLTSKDFENFDWIVAMDYSNMRNIQKIPGVEQFKGRLCLLRDFDPQGQGDVPDPYVGGPEMFDHVFRICERSCRALLEEIKKTSGLGKTLPTA